MLCFFILSHQRLIIQIFIFLFSYRIILVRVAFWLLAIEVGLLILNIFSKFKLILTFIFIINLVKLVLIFIVCISPNFRRILIVWFFHIKWMNYLTNNYKTNNNSMFYFTIKINIILIFNRKWLILVDIIDIFLILYII